MEVLKKVNILLLVIGIVLIAEAMLYYDGDLVGQGFKVLDKEIIEDVDMVVTPVMKDEIKKAGEAFISGDEQAARVHFNRLMEMRVEEGKFDLNEFNDLLPLNSRRGYSVVASDGEAGYIVIDKYGFALDKVEELQDFMENQDKVFQTLFYILAPDEFVRTVVEPDRNRYIEYDGDFYYYYRDEGLFLKKYSWIWFDLEMPGEMQRTVFTNEVFKMIRTHRLPILLDEDHLFKYEPDTRKSTVGKSIQVLNRISLS